jgi:polyphosphate kinase 2 (PPK2 family)
MLENIDLDRKTGKAEYKQTKAELDFKLAALQRDVKALVEGTVIIKFFLHISKKEQKRRFDALRKNPATAFRVNQHDLEQHRGYANYVAASENMLAETDAATDAFQASILDGVDLTLSLTRKEYEARLKKAQTALRDLEYEVYSRRVPVVIAFEGWDAAGKGGSIRRLTRNLDPRGYEVVPVAAPNDIEKAHHYLWRFWAQMPKAGHITIFDRTWYGRVLVERIEGFCTEAQWRRAYGEINEMERHLALFGTILLKFWLHIDPAEQLRRFREREKLDHKKWKITEEDWRNRKKMAEYHMAVEMLYRTSTPLAPWTVVEYYCKYYARVKVVETVCNAIRKRLKVEG